MRVDCGVDDIVNKYLPKDSTNWRKAAAYDQMKGGLKARMEFYDAAVKIALKQGAKQILELGGGLGTRVVRLKLNDVPYYETDMGDFFVKKAKGLKEEYKLENYHFANINYIETDPIKTLNIDTS